MVSDHTRLGHWILDGDLAHSHLLRFALKEANFTDTTVLLCVAMTTPWNIMDQLQNWATLLHDHIDKLTLSAEETKQLQNESEYNGHSLHIHFRNIFEQYKSFGVTLISIITI